LTSERHAEVGVVIRVALDLRVATTLKKYGAR
jgi:hypothetical protein